YSYGGTWNTGWTTTVTDPLGNQEGHTFPGAGGAAGIALESQTQYLDAGGALLKQGDNIWGATEGTVQLGFALGSPQDNIGSATVLSANDQPSAITGIDMLIGVSEDRREECVSGPLWQDVQCLQEAAVLLNQINNLPAYFRSGISIAASIPLSNGSITFTGARNTVLLSQTTTLYNGSQTLVTTTQTDYNDCSTFTNFNSYISSTTGNFESFTDCRDNPTQIREYDYNTPANNAVFGNGHSATSPAPASRYTDISYWHATNSAFGP